MKLISKFNHLASSKISLTVKTYIHPDKKNPAKRRRQLAETICI